MTWSAVQYSLFEEQRNRPIRDLLSAVPALPCARAADLGCGPGNSTELLAARFPDAAIIGIDSSPEMIAAARSRLPRLRFERAAIESWGDAEPFDMLLANAVLQWLPDHAALLPALIAKLAHGGCLAVQMPDNLEEPVSRLMRETAAAGPWAGRLAEAVQSRTVVGRADWYHAVLEPICSRVDVWRTVYHHALPGGHAAVVEWFKGSGLRPFLDALDAGERPVFLERYLAGLRRELAPLPGGGVLLPFPRLFMVAIR